MPQPRKPTQVHELTGAFKHNPDRGRARAGEPKPNGPIGDPPDELTPEQRALWREYVAIVPPGVMCRADRSALHSLVVVTERAREGHLPALTEQRQWMSKFGLTPADRSRVSVPKQSDEDEWDSLLN